MPQESGAAYFSCEEQRFLRCDAAARVRFEAPAAGSTLADPEREGRRCVGCCGRIWDGGGSRASAARFAWIALHPDRPEEFMKAALGTDGWTTQSRVAVLADGADGL